MSQPPMSRRDFARKLGVVAALSGSASLTSGASADDAETPPDADADSLLLAALLLEYPANHLTEEMLAGIRVGIRQNRAQGRSLRSVPLENSDAPSILFRAYRKE